MTTMSGCIFMYVQPSSEWWTKPGVSPVSSSLQHIVFPSSTSTTSALCLDSFFYIWPNCCMQMLPGKQAQSNMHNMCCSFIRITVSLQLPRLQLQAALAVAVAAFDGCLCCCCLLSYEACECRAKVWEGNKNLLLIKVDNCTVCFI